MTHRDGLPRFSARSARRGDAGHREACATLSESLGKPPFRSSPRPVRGHGVSPFFYSGGRPRDPRRASESLDDAPHRPWLPSYPTDRGDDPYESLSPLLGIKAGQRGSPYLFFGLNLFAKP